MGQTGRVESYQPNTTRLINGSNRSCRVNPLFKWVVLRSKGLTLLVKRVGQGWPEPDTWILFANPNSNLDYSMR